MPKYTNKLKSPAYIEQSIIKESDDGKRSLIGVVRVKPSGILWKPKGAQSFHSVSLDQFTDWITNPATGAKKVKQ